MKKLVLAGSGIKSISHLTTEFRAYAQKAEKVLYLVNEPLVEAWIKQNTQGSESLEDIYFSNANRLVSYTTITQKILDELEQVIFLMVVIYGHPTVFSEPGLNAILQADKKGVETLILPGISAEDCLYTDLRIDPGLCGCFHVEATELLVFDKIIDPSAHLIVWQVGMIGNMSTPTNASTSNYLDILQEKLLKSYPEEQLAIIYEASLYQGVKPTIQKFELKDLQKQKVTTLSTLYISPIRKMPNKSMLERLSLKLSDISSDL